MTKLRKSIVTLLSLALVMAMLPMAGITALAEDYSSFTDDGFEYYISDGAVSIISYSGKATNLTIPSEIEGCPVTVIGEWAFENCDTLVSVVIPDTVTTIGTCAFAYCDALTTVTIPEGVQSIGSYAFECTPLESITIPSTVTSIESPLLFENPNITAIDVAAGNTSYLSEDGVLFSYDKSELICYPAGKTGTSYTIPSDVSAIGDFAFAGCTTLESVTIPEGVESIGYYAFQLCESLASIVIPDSVTTLNFMAFINCSSLKSVTIGSGVTAILMHTFAACTSLESITFPDSVTSIGVNAFNGCTALTTVDTGDGVETVSDYAFSNCTALKTVTLGASVSSVSTYTFSSCTALERIEVSPSNENYSSVDGVLFDSEQSQLIRYPAGKTDSSYTVPDGVGVLMNYAFSDCTKLTSVTIPESVYNLGMWTFRGSTSLEDVIILSNDAEINVYTYGNIFLNCTALKNITVAVDNSSYATVDGVLFSKDMSTLYLYPAGKTATSYDIPEGVTEIQMQAFNGCNLETITIPSTLTTISYYAFYGCENLKNITIPDTVTSIGTSAFRNCSSLTSIVIPDSVTSMGDLVFYRCSSLESITIGAGLEEMDTGFSYCTALSEINVSENNPSYCSVDGVLFSKDMTTLVRYPLGRADTSYTIPDSITTIGTSAFESSTALETVTIPDTVTTIEDAAFYSCMAMSSITIPQSVTTIGTEACGVATYEVYIEGELEYSWVDAIDGFTVYGYSGSVAETYVDEINNLYGNGDTPLTFVAVDALLIGDANGDGNITTADALIILGYAVGGTSTLTEYEFTVCDYNNDTTITTVDALAVLRAAVGMA